MDWSRNDPQKFLESIVCESVGFVGRISRQSIWLDKTQGKRKEMSRFEISGMDYGHILEYDNI